MWFVLIVVLCYYCVIIMLLLFIVSYYNYFTFYKFFTPVLAGDLSLESEWQQVSSSVHDSSQYPGQSQQYCDLDGLDSSSDFQFF